MAVQLEHLYVAFPHRLASENLFDGYAFDVAGLDAMQSADDVTQFFYVGVAHDFFIS
jgi:hypothetical protein